jgi:hypothetical protein
MDTGGKWNLIIESPMGKQDVSIDVTSDDGRLTGTLVNNGNKLSSDIFDGTADGNQLRFKVKLQQIKVTLSFDTVVDGETMSGLVKAGMFGKFKVSGRRA